MHRALLPPGVLLAGLLGISCAQAPESADPGPPYALSGPAGDGGSWWDENAPAEGCARALPTDGWKGAIDPDLATSEPYDFDAGIAELSEIIEQAGASSTALANPFPIEGAIIINVGSSPDAEFWFADGQAVLSTADLPGGASGVRPGDRVSFLVTHAKNGDNGPQVTGISEFAVLDRDNPVYVEEATLESLSEDDLGWNQHLVIEVEGGARTCGVLCFDIPLSDGESLTLRVDPATEIGQGACVEIWAPLGAYRGDLQFNAAAPGGNPDWVRRFD